MIPQPLSPAKPPAFDTPGCVAECNGWDSDVLVKIPSGQIMGPFNNGTVSQGSLTAAPLVHNPRDSYGSTGEERSEPLETAVIGSGAQDGVYKVIGNKCPAR